jgi:hypothetical protein
MMMAILGGLIAALANFMRACWNLRGMRSYELVSLGWQSLVLFQLANYAILVMTLVISVRLGDRVCLYLDYFGE